MRLALAVLAVSGLALSAPAVAQDSANRFQAGKMVVTDFLTAFKAGKSFPTTQFWFSESDTATVRESDQQEIRGLLSACLAEQVRGYFSGNQSWGDGYSYEAHFKCPDRGALHSDVQAKFSLGASGVDAMWLTNDFVDRKAIVPPSPQARPAQ